jgi:hypothetical protein
MKKAKKLIKGGSSGRVYVSLYGGVKVVASRNKEILGHLPNGLPILRSSFAGVQFTEEQLDAALNKVLQRTISAGKRA